jgi:exopolysaccharide biosynthesis polyprenyl glycosylphosphotransferase
MAATEYASTAAPTTGERLTSAHPQVGRHRIRRGWVVRRALIAADVAALLTAFFASELLIAQDARQQPLSPLAASAIFIALLPVWIVAAKLYGLYDRDEERTLHSTADEVVHVFHLITVGAWSIFLAAWLFGLTRPSEEKLIVFWLTGFLAIVAARVLARSLARRHPAYVQNTLIVGAGDVGQLIARKLRQHPEYRIKLIGFMDSAPKAMRDDIGEVCVFSDADDVISAVRSSEIDRVVIAFSQDRDEQLADLVRELRAQGVQIDVVPRLFDTVGPTSTVHAVEGLPLLSLAAVRISRSSRALKRALDIAGATVLLTIAAPLMLLIAFLVRRDSPGGALFRQTRLGMDQTRFTLLKFRTMYTGTDDAPHREYLKHVMSPAAGTGTNRLYKLDRSKEITRVGRWLRKTSLDELPQLVNVLRGDMSLVGPRPALPYELELYEPHHRDRFAVPGGITGLWQVEARAHSTFREALDLDVAYVHGWSLGLDLRLLLRTPLLVFRKNETV